MWAKHPEIAEKWSKKYGDKPLEGLKKAALKGKK